MPERKAKNILFWIFAVIGAAAIATMLFSCGEFDDNVQREQASQITTETAAQPLTPQQSAMLTATPGSKEEQKVKFCDELLKDELFRNYYPFTAVVFRDSTGMATDTIVVGRGEARKFVGFFEKKIVGFEPYVLQKRKDEPVQ